MLLSLFYDKLIKNYIKKGQVTQKKKKSMRPVLFFFFFSFNFVKFVNLILSRIFFFFFRLLTKQIFPPFYLGGMIYA